MTVQIDTTAEIDAVRLKTEGSHPSAPASGHVLLYFVTGTASPGLFVENSVGQKVGPFITGSVNSSGGALILLEQHVASSSASLDFTTAISSTYDDYLIEFIDVLPATNNVTLNMQLSIDGGSSYDTTSGHYAWNIQDFDNSGASYGGSTSDTKIGVQKLGTSNTANNGGICGQLLFHNPGSAIYKKLEYRISFWFQGGELLSSQGSGIYLQTTAVNAFQFLFSSGNMAGGTIRVYGIAKT
jgi:hypothetical protein